MAKDPAFLFYSKDFYEGTRLMLPEERACLIDLMVFQHQNGGIPNDIKRLTLYCSGITEDVISATLKLKFKLIDSEWYNDKMSEVTTERSEKGRKNKLIGTFGHVIKKLNLSAKDEKALKSKFDVSELLKSDSEWDSERLSEWCKNAIALIANANASNSNVNNSNIEFSVFWDLYHSTTGLRMTDKKPTEKYWELLTDKEKQNAIDGIYDYYNSLSNKKYCKKARTYLSDKNFNDEMSNVKDLNYYWDNYPTLSNDEKDILTKEILKFQPSERSQREVNHLEKYKPSC